jgi:hypothetical protein
MILSSCNQSADELIKSDTIKNNDFELVKLSEFVDSNVALRYALEQKEALDQVVIRFRDELAYKQTIEKLQAMSKREQLTWTQALKGFTSLREIFEQAMKDVDTIGETEVTYMAL